MSKDNITKYDSPFILSDEEILEKGIPSSCVDAFRKKHYQNSYAVTTWYGGLKNHTFKTEVLALEISEAKSIINLHRNIYWKSSSKKYEVDEEALGNLESRIDKVLDEFFGSGCFVKLDTRSPKDAPYYLDEDEEMQEIVNAEFVDFEKEEFIKNMTEEELIDTIFLKFHRSMIRGMKVMNGKKAIKLLVHSTRAYQDLSRGLRFGDKNYNCNLVLREWDDEVVDFTQFEFRCFVHNHQMNAISQYCSDNYIEEIVKKKEDFKERIHLFFEKEVKKQISHPSYVIDIFCGPSKMLVIELNPFHIGCGACNFSWKEDRELFLNGPLEIRVQEKRPEKILLDYMLTDKWKEYLMNRYKLEILSRLTNAIPPIETEKQKDTKKKEKESDTACIVQ